MYCPKCSQAQISEDIRFCSRCGFLLTGVAQLIANDGIVAEAPEKRKKLRGKLRERGIKQGMFMFLLSVLLTPILFSFTIWFRLGPEFFTLAVFMLFAASIIRIAYSALFEHDAKPADSADRLSQNVLAGNKTVGELSGVQTNPINDFIPPIKGNWRDSNELVFSSVTDVTTKQLDKKQ